MPDSPVAIIAREQRQRRRLAALLDISRRVTSSLDPQAILETVAETMSDLVGATEVTIFGVNDEGTVLRPLAMRVEEKYREDVQRMRIRVGEGITGHVFQSGVPEIVGHAESDPRAIQIEGTPEDDSTSLVCVPFSVKDRPVGVITLSRYGVDQFDSEDLEIVTIFAGHCSVAIANAGLYADLRKAFEELHATQGQLVQSAKLNALGEMASGVAHDFNNLLAAILGRTQLMLTRTEEPEMRRSLEVIEQMAQDGAKTVRRIQEFTRVRQDEVLDDVDLSQILRDVIELTSPMWQTQAKSRGITIEIVEELAREARIAGNASELREVFTNLVLNAIDAMPAGGTLHVATGLGDGRAWAEVRDTGHGMDDHTQARCFDPFFTTKSEKGTGLGLSVAYGIVSRHKGTFELESSACGGTVFRLAFAESSGSASPASSRQAAPSPGSFRMLVVDDEPAVLSVLSELLEALGHTVTSALGGPEGIEHLRSGTGGGAPEVVFTDLGMPKVGGWDIARESNQLHPDTFVVLVTGWGVQIDLETARSKGVDFLLAKPFTVEDIEHALRNVRQAMDAGTRRAA